ncbi:PilC/PilY family type IV pilus protein [Alloalcanivorax mobilis]|uniref:PilC/PilY family type IV pilus protein n=1 Tax=Alloalcanivorax mobilis TaxID=2019569 RepID=UPI000C785622|nr:PilC/PilY family type IV pilus protein [Alloalcanivorax mobilis]
MNRLPFFLFALLAAIVLSPTPLYADDTEIYFGRADVGNSENEAAANVLFLIDTSGSMCDPPSGSRDCSKSSTKMYQLKQAFTQVVDGLGEGVRIGVGKFNGGADNNGYGGYVFYPVSEMTAAKRTEVKNLVNGLQGTSNTPTMEAYSEMARYMLGKPPSNYAKAGEALNNDPRLSVNIQCYGSGRNRQCYTDSYYSSPMNMANQCESNHIIVMTDGDPTYDSDEDAVNDLTNGRCSVSGGSSSGNSYNCQVDLANWLYDKDKNGKRSVKTWQVAFGQNISKLSDMKRVAVSGGTDEVRLADNAEELAAEFNDILDLIAEDSQSIVSPGVTINQTNRLEHLDQLYFAVFKPEKTSVWAGNLKRYKLDDGEVVDKNGRAAVDDDTGYFRDDATSFWSPEVDGADAKKGGALSQLQNRKLVIGNSDGNGEVLLNDARIADNNLTNNATFGIPDNNANPEFDNKYKVYNALKTLWADPMHSVPLLVNYEVGSDEDGSDQTNYLFVSSNSGMLHAIDTQNGEEKFTFMPDEMVKRAYDFVRSPPLEEGNRRSLYGMDGTWAVWRTQDDDGDADNVYIYGGMRRGGNAYYGLDVSDINDPEVMWRVHGPRAGESATSGFELLGQTWSTPTVTRVRTGDGVKNVLVFGGGYDPQSHDTIGQRAGTDEVGRAVYMVDAETGELIWSASKGQNNQGEHTSTGSMDWSVPGGMTVVDLNFDGLADYLYFGDLGGQVFRVNINNSGGDDLVDGVVRLAKFSTNSASGYRRFYEAPAVGYVKSGLSETLYVGIGSGYRAHPLDETTHEAFYMIADSDFRQASQPDQVLGPNDLPVLSAANPSLDEAGSGWQFNLRENGEKVLAQATIFQGDVLFTTFVPSVDDQDDDPCVVRYGSGFVYRSDMVTGEPRQFNNDGVLEGGAWDDPLETDNGGIPPPVVPFYDSDDTTKFLVGAEVIGGEQNKFNNLRKHRWYPMQKNKANEYFPPVQEASDE